MMDADLKAKWVKALRGQGEKVYKQGRYYFKTYDDRYCCLGVLCDISGVIEWKESEMRGIASTPLFVGDKTPHPTILPHFGIPAHVGDELINRNDGAKEYAQHTFPEIADIIENHPEL